MPRVSHAELVALLDKARTALGVKTLGMARQIGSSRRTIERWFANEASPTDAHLIQLARVVHPRNPTLATAIAAAVGESPATLGLAKGRPGPGDTHLIDAVVCVAAETIDVPSLSLRPALLAAFRRARELGFTIEDGEKALTPAQ